MTRAEALLYRRRHLLWVVAALLIIGGGVALALIQVHRAQQRADQLASEADRRGTAVSTLATDVRTLRQQVRDAGATPAAPDPADAVDGLPDRAEVPVPIPGPRGERGITGPRGATGAPGKTGAAGDPGDVGADGTDGSDGAAGTAGPPGPAGEPGPAGPPGADGRDGAPGKDGRDGQTCPDGYTLQPLPADPDALVCRRDDAPADGDSGSTPPQAAGLDPTRRQYR
ncbi:collagen-like protein [Streptomyces sp. NPDC050560]|uniref:collagen-like protein n=1 Tax=Streptomyces sp. NPDC050560 TaxID=3365630 RepID=UPI00378BC73F